MESAHLERLVKLCETLPEAELRQLKAGLDKFFEKNPMTEDVRRELRGIHRVSGGLNEELIGYGIGSLIVVVAVGLIAWFLMHEKAKYKKLMSYNYVYSSPDTLKVILKNPKDQAAGIINDFTLEQLEPTPRTNYSRRDQESDYLPKLIKPWLLSEKYPGKAVFVYGKPWEWFRGGGNEHKDWDKELVMQDLDELKNDIDKKNIAKYNEFVNDYKMPLWYDSYKTAIDFHNINFANNYETLLTDENLKEVIRQLTSVRKWLMKYDNMLKEIIDMAFMPLLKWGKGSNLFIPHELYNYNHSINPDGLYTDEEWKAFMQIITKLWSDPKSRNW